MLIISLPIAVFMFLASKVKFYQVVYFIGVLLILHLCFSAEIMRATRECERIHNNISWGIEFDYNCEKEDKKKSDADSEDADKHMCFIMRWYCARRCTMSVYDRKCSVQSLFTLNLEEEDDGTPVTLDCVCTYRKYKKGCLSTYQFLWSDVLTEFESNCAKQVQVTTKKPNARKPDTKIILIGGKSDDPAKSIELYYPDKQKSELLKKTLLKTRSLHTSFSIDEQTIITAGGMDETGNQISDCEIFNPTTNEVKLCKTNLNSARQEAASVVLDGIAYICGGMGNLAKMLSSCERYRSGGVWEYVEQMTTYRVMPAMAALDGFLYAIGGVSAPDLIYSKTAERYNPNKASDTWSLIEPMKIERVDAAAAVLNELLYVCGGYGYGSQYHRTCEVYNLIKGKWSDFKTMISKRSGFNLLVYNNRLFAIGNVRYDTVAEIEMCDLLKGTDWVEKKDKLNIKHGSAVVLP